MKPTVEQVSTTSRPQGDEAAPRLSASTASATAASALTWSSTAIGPSLGDDATAWDALASRLAAGHPALRSRCIDAWLQTCDAAGWRLVWQGPRSAPLAMGILEPAGTGRWRVVAPPGAWTSALLLAQPDALHGLPAALPESLQTLLWPRWDPQVLPIDLGRIIDTEVLASTCELLLGERDAQPSAALRCTLHRTPAALTEAWQRLQVLAADPAGAVWPPQRPPGTATTPAPAGWTALADRGLAALIEVRAAGRLCASLALTGDQGRWLTCQAVLLPSQATPAALLGAAAAMLADAPGQAPALQWVLPGQVVGAATPPGFGQRHHRADLQLPLGGRPWWRPLPDRPAGSAGDGPLPNADGATGVPAASHASGRRSLRCDDSLAALPASGHALLAAQAGKSLQHHGEWLAAMEAVLSKERGVAPRIYSLWDGAQPLAVVALQRRAAAGIVGARALHSLSNFYSVVWAPALACGVGPRDLAPLVARLRADAGRMEFAPIDPNAASTWVWVQALRDAGLVVLRQHGFGNWIHLQASDFKTYLAGRSSQLRRMIKRANQRLQERGGRLEICTRAEDMARAMDAYEAVYAKSWKQAEPHPEFFRGLATRWAASNRMRIGVAWLGDQPIAAQWWTCHAGVAEIHKLAYDEVHAELGAGTALSAALFAHALDQDGVHKIDYLIGDDAYKRLWMSRRESRCRLLVFDPYSVAGLGGLLRETAARGWRAWQDSRAARLQPDAAGATAQATR